MSGGLFDPLGMDRADHDVGARRPAAPVVAVGLLLAGLAALLVVSWFRDDGDRGRPSVVAPIERIDMPRRPLATATVPPAPPSAAPQAAVAAGGLPPVRDDQEVEIQNGVRIVRPRRDGPASSGLTIRVPDTAVPR